jgi:hypothetical protein
MVGIYPPLEIFRGQLCSAVSTLTYFLNFHLIFNHVKISTFRQQSGYGLDGMKAVCKKFFGRVPSRRNSQ